MSVPLDATAARLALDLAGGASLLLLRHFDLLLREAPHRATPLLVGPSSGLLPVT